MRRRRDGRDQLVCRNVELRVGLVLSGLFDVFALIPAGTAGSAVFYWADT
jgi:hypothetical protein